MPSSGQLEPYFLSWRSHYVKVKKKRENIFLLWKHGWMVQVEKNFDAWLWKHSHPAPLVFRFLILLNVVAVGRRRCIRPSFPPTSEWETNTNIRTKIVTLFLQCSFFQTLPLLRNVSILKITFILKQIIYLHCGRRTVTFQVEGKKRRMCTINSLD